MTTTVSKKLQVGAATFAAAAVLITPSIAFADTDDSDSGSDSVGTSAGSPPKPQKARDRRGAVSRAGSDANGPSASGGASANIEAPASIPDVTEDLPDIPEVSTADVPEVTAGATADANAAFDNPLFQNPLIWIGTPNPNPPAPIVEFTTDPLADVPENLRGSFGWMEDFEFEACVLGLSSVTRGQNVVGPYGTATSGVSGGGCA